MATVTTHGIGQRIAMFRRRRGMSQVALAGLIDRSESWISQVERGVRSVDRVSVLLDMARVLHVEVEALVGTTWNFAPNGESLTDGLAGLRQVFTSYQMLLTARRENDTIDISSFQGDVENAHRLYQVARYDDVISLLPDMLVSADKIRQKDVRSKYLLAYVSAYVVTAKLVTKLGAGDLAMLAADRAANAAADSGSPVARGMAAYQVVCALLRTGHVEDAERVAVGMATNAAEDVRHDDPAQVSVTGALWLIAAIIAGRRTDRDEAWRRLDEADRLASILGEDGNHGWTAFGPTNVALHRVTVATELGDAGEALRAAEGVALDDLPNGLLSRRAQVNLDLAWAEAQRRRDADAILHLLEAERVAPQVIRHNVVARQVARDLLARASQPRTSALESLASRAGLLD